MADINLTRFPVQEQVYFLNYRIVSIPAINDKMSAKDDVLKYLEKLDISYEIFEHPPVYTVEEANKYWKDIDALHCKNLFFRDPKGRQHYMVIVPFDRQINIREFWERIGSGRLSFASKERMWKYLKLNPGSVSPFGLINDSEDHVYVYLDEKLRQVEKVAFHPNENTHTLILSSADLQKFLENTGNRFEFLEFE